MFYMKNKIDKKQKKTLIFFILIIILHKTCENVFKIYVLVRSFFCRIIIADFFVSLGSPKPILKFV